MLREPDQDIRAFLAARWRPPVGSGRRDNHIETVFARSTLPVRHRTSPNPPASKRASIGAITQNRLEVIGRPRPRALRMGSASFRISADQARSNSLIMSSGRAPVCRSGISELLAGAAHGRRDLDGHRLEHAHEGVPGCILGQAFSGAKRSSGIISIRRRGFAGLANIRCLPVRDFAFPARARYWPNSRAIRSTSRPSKRGFPYMITAAPPAPRGYRLMCNACGPVCARLRLSLMGCFLS